MLVGVDIGGTFTDFCQSIDGQLHIHKVLSTPGNPAQGMLAGLAELNPGGLAAITRVSHGSTVATNAILERKGMPTALITTQGFRDILAIGRQDRPVLYALQPQIPPALVPRKWCYEVPERLDHHGTVLVPLDVGALDRVLDSIEREGIRSVAVCLLYSYVNPAHERLIRTRILERGMLHEDRIALSYDVLPEFREYERASTAALEAYVRPVVNDYLQQLEAALSPGWEVPAGVKVDLEGTRVLAGRPEPRSLRIIKSDGGMMSARRARYQAVHTVLSGPAAGVIGGFYLAQRAGFDRVITLDMGGTSTDVSLCPGVPVRRTESQIDGLALRTRSLDIESIGAGGGSLARLDAGGALRVGPESAGADPGPIVYGLGGSKLTVTDANALLGRLDAAHFMGGAMPLYLDPARTALEQLAGKMGLSPEAAALGIVNVANVNIDRALRKVSIARGYDPRTFTLVAFGGAGPLHACEVAARLQIPRVLVPRYPGVLCAFGLLMADVVLERSRSVLCPLDEETAGDLWALLGEMTAQARAELEREGIGEEDMTCQGWVDARYRGQSYELTIPFVGLSASELLSAFHAAHGRSFGHTMPGRMVEVVTVRLQATGVVEKPALVPELAIESRGAAVRLGQKRVVCRAHRPGGGEARPIAALEPERPQLVDLYERARLEPGAAFAGPALIFQMDSTVFVPPGWSARVDGYCNLVLECAP